MLQLVLIVILVTVVSTRCPHLLVPSPYLYPLPSPSYSLTHTHTHLRQAQRAALINPGVVGFSTALDLGWSGGSTKIY